MVRVASDIRGGSASARTLRRGLLLLVVALIAMGGAKAGLVIFGAKSAHAGKAAPERPVVGVFAPLPPMEITLADGARTRQVDLRVVLELPPGTDRKQLDANVPRILHALNTRLIEATPAELQGAGGTQIVKDVVSVAANRELKPIRVRDVLLQRFIIN